MRRCIFDIDSCMASNVMENLFANVVCSGMKMGLINRVCGDIFLFWMILLLSYVSRELLLYDYNIFVYNMIIIYIT